MARFSQEPGPERHIAFGRSGDMWVVVKIMVPFGALNIPKGPKVVPFWGSYLEFYKVIPKRNYFGAYG